MNFGAIFADSSLHSWNWLAPAIVVAAALMSAGLTAALRPLLARYALAKPNVRSSHRAPTPQGGGFGVVAATVAIALLAVLNLGGTTTSFVSELGGIIVATLLIVIVGAADDIRAIEVVPRLLLQAIAVGIVIVTLPSDLRIVPVLPWWLERALLLVGGLYFVNLVNFMDGLDWMTVAEIVPVTGGLALIGALGALPGHAVVLALALGGAVLGFAPFNRPIARLFLGDVGSLPIGLLLGWLLVLLAARGQLAAALLLPLYYLGDGTVTLLRRIANGEPFWQAHRTHFYQRATDRGFSVMDIIARVFAVNLVLVALAAFSVLLPTRVAHVVTLALGIATVTWLLASFARGKT